MICSTTYLMDCYVGLYEWPVEGLMIAGIWGALYLQRIYVCWPHASETGSSRMDCFLILLSYLVLGRGCGRCLNLSGLRGFLSWSFSSSTTSVDGNWSLTFYVCCCSTCSRSAETSIFLFHFFLFCLPLSPLILMSSVMEVWLSENDYNNR